MTSTPYSLKEFWNIVATLSNDLRHCAGELQSATKEEDAKAVMFWRRMCAHTVCAAIAGTTYHMMYIAYVARQTRDVVFSLAEIEALEKAYDFAAANENEAELTAAQMCERIKFAFNAFARVHYSDYILPINDAEWSQLKEIFAIRKKLSQPQSTEALGLSDADVNALLEGTAWFMQCMVSLLESSQQSVEEQAALWEDEKDEPIM